MYRYLYKQAKYNRNIIRQMLDFNQYNNIEITDNLSKSKIEDKISFLLDLSKDFIKMKKIIIHENNLLYSYNINVNRNNKDQIRKTANYVGLKV